MRGVLRSVCVCEHMVGLLDAAARRRDVPQEISWSELWIWERKVRMCVCACDCMIARVNFMEVYHM